MLKLRTTAQFRKDYKLAKKRGLKIERLENIINMLLEEKSLPESAHDHALHGSYSGFRECHIEPDWLLIYAVENGQTVLVASRTGTHSDLF